MSDNSLLPKPIPINQMTLMRLQGQLQLSGTPKEVQTGEAQAKAQAAIKVALEKVRSFLQESGHSTILVTNKGKSEDPESYTELRIEERQLTLRQVSASNKLETTYFFETQKLSVGNSMGDIGHDLEKFATKINKISDWMAEKKVDVIGGNHP